MYLPDCLTGSKIASRMMPETTHIPETFLKCSLAVQLYTALQPRGWMSERLIPAVLKTHFLLTLSFGINNLASW